jgi:hypothetical protein
MSMDRIIREEARLIILRALDEQPDRRLNSSLLQASLEAYGITKSREWVHDVLRELADLATVTVSEANTGSPS